VSERLLNDDPCSGCAARYLQGLDYGRKQAGRNGEIVSRASYVAEKGAEGGERRRASVVSIDVLQQLEQTGKRGVVHASPVSLDAVARALPQLVNGPSRFCNPDHRDI